MDGKDLLKIARLRTILINKIADALQVDVQGAQRDLLEMVISDFLDKLDITDGKIANTVKNKRLIGTLDQVFTKFGGANGIEIANSIVGGVQQIFDFNQNYFSNFTSSTKLQPIMSGVQDVLNGWLGIDDEGNVSDNGYISNLINDNTVRNKVKDYMVGKIVGGSGIAEARAGLKNLIDGTPDKLGLMESHYSSFVYDTYSQVDRTASKIVADKLSLDYAIYEGGTIKNSREFCIIRNGKVFTRAEISEFDPPEAQPNYNPFTDLGGWNCRHHLNWIPYSIAVSFRPDLQEN